MADSHEAAIHHYNLGIQYEREQNTAKAVEEYERALKQDPHFPYPYKALGELFYKCADLKQAHRYLSRALKLDPEWIEVLTQLALIYFDMGEVDKALTCQESALKKEPNSVAANAAYGKYLSAAGRYDEAVRALENARKLDPDYYLANYYLALAYGKRGIQDMDRAIDAWHRAAALDPEDSQVFRNLGLALFYRGRMDEAAEAFNKAYRLNPEDTVAARFLQFADSVKSLG